MKVIFYLLIAIFLFSNTSCATKPGKYYKSCIDKELLPTGIDFYQEMDNAENLLIKIGMLQGRDRKAYLNAFKKVFDTQYTKESYQEIKRKFLSDFDLRFVSFQLFSQCSDIKIVKNEDGCNCINIHKSILKKFVFRSYDDKELLDDMFVFTDFNDEILRKHMTYLLLLNLEMEYGESKKQF
jgi:hypothetical protein